MASEVSREEDQTRTLQGVAYDSPSPEENTLGSIESAKPQATDSLPTETESAVEKPSKHNPGARDNKSANLSKVRKRTKTGCLSK